MPESRGQATPWPGVDGAPPCLYEGYGARYTAHLAQLAMTCSGWLTDQLAGKRMRLDRFQAALRVAESLPHFVSMREHYGNGCCLVMASRTDLARVTGLPESTVRNALADLAGPGGPLTRVYNSRSRHRTSAYVFTAELDAPADRAALPDDTAAEPSTTPSCGATAAGDAPQDGVVDVGRLVAHLAENLAHA